MELQTASSSQPLFVPGGVYRTSQGELVEYISTSGKNGRDKESGLRFYNLNIRDMVTVPVENLAQTFDHVGPQ